jgi:hypothetical protein
MSLRQGGAILPACSNQGARHLVERIMKNGIQKSWEAKRNKAIERFVAAWEKHDSGKDPEPVNTALDAITVAHIAAKLEWDSGPVRRWEDVEEKAMERLAAAWEKLDGDGNPEVEEELNIALDTLAVAHSAAALEGWSGPLKW